MRCTWWLSVVVIRLGNCHCIVDASLHSLLAAKVIGATLPAANTDPDLSKTLVNVKRGTYLLIKQQACRLNTCKWFIGFES